MRGPLRTVRTRPSRSSIACIAREKASGASVVSKAAAWLRNRCAANSGGTSTGSVSRTALAPRSRVSGSFASAASARFRYVARAPTFEPSETTARTAAGLRAT